MDTTIYERIIQKRQRVLSLWQAASQPQGQGLLFKATSKTRFTTPAELLFKDETTALLDWLISEDEPIKARPTLMELCKFKAVSGLNPSEALSFILDLKEIIRLVLGETGPATNGTDKLISTQTNELIELDKRIDQLMLLAFDEYMDCRERIMEIKVDEVKRLAGMDR